MLAGAIGEITSFSKISDTAGGFTGGLVNDDYFGRAVANLGDLDGDGVADLAVGADYDDDGGTDRGAVYVLLLNADGTVKSHQKISDTTGNFTATLDDSDYFGSSLANLGDFDGDGVIDLAVGARGDDDGGTEHGAVYVLLLNDDGTVKSHQKISDTEGSFTAILSDEDGFGEAVTSIGDLDSDGVTDLAVAAEFDDDGGTDHGAVYVLLLNADGTVKSHQKISDTEGGFTPTLDIFDRFGSAVANLGDLDGDGVTDLAIGALGDDDGGSGRGAVYVLFLNADGTVNSHQKISSTAGGFTGGLGTADSFGNSLSNLGDLDGDGVTDLAVGSYGDDDGATNRGAAYLLFLNADGTVKSHQKISDTEGNFTATLENYDNFGGSLTNLGDLDGDGLAELVVGARRDNDGGSNRGAVYILSLDQVPLPGVITAEHKVSDTAGNLTAMLEDADRFGRAVAELGDLDGDGVADLAVGAYGDDDGDPNAGAVYILLLNADGTVKSHQKTSDTAGNLSSPLNNNDGFGYSLANLGDLDGDGITDLAVGAARDDDGGTDRGAVFVLFLNANGTIKSHQKISDTIGGFTGSLGNGDNFGSSLANLGDLDGDGVDDLAVGADFDDDGGMDKGAVYVLFLNANGTVKSHQKISDTQGGFTGGLTLLDRFGTALANLGDLDGDGVTDLAVGSNRDSDNGNNRGSVYVLFLNFNGTVKAHQKISDTEGGFTATLDDADVFGSSLANLGDLDGDGIDDLAVGAYADDDGGSLRGAVYVLLLKPDGTVKSHQKISETTGNFTGPLDNGDRFGISLTNMGDLDGDGVPELVVGAFADDDGGFDRGAVYIFSLKGLPPWVDIQNGVLTVTGTNVGDAIDVTESPGGNIVITYNGIVTPVPSGYITSVVVEGSSGFDTLRHLGETTIPVTLIGQAGNDTIIGNAGAETLIGGPGADTINGGDGNDTIRGGSGNDNLFGEAGKDMIFGDKGNDQIEGGDGDDAIFGGGGQDNILGGAGNDDIRAQASIDTIDGGTGNDTLLGGGAADEILGGGGHDFINGEHGDDVISGGSGNDEIRGAGGNDTISGDNGNDTIDGGAGNDTIRGGFGSDDIRGSSGDDVTDGEGGHDILHGGSGNDIVLGGTGNDHLVSTAGSNILIGGVGVDELTGAGGDDILIGATTTHDANIAALQMILAEWTSAAAAATRVENIRNGTGLSGGNTLAAGSSVLDDSAADTLRAGNGDDWVFRNLLDDTLVDTPEFLDEL